MHKALFGRLCLLLTSCGGSANASETQPAKLLAVFVVDTSEAELTTPIAN